MAAINPDAPVAQQLVNAVKNAMANREGVITLEQQSQMSGAQRISRLTPNFDPIQRQPMKVERVDLGEIGRLDNVDPREMADRVRSVIGRLNPIMHNQTDLSFRLHEDSERFFSPGCGSHAKRNRGNFSSRRLSQAYGRNGRI